VTAPIAALVVASLLGRPVSLTASAMSWANGVVTATVPAQNDPVGTQYPITVAGVTPAGYNGSYQGTLIAPTTITYPLATNPGPVTVQGTVAFNSGFTAAGVAAPFFNLAIFDPTTGAITAQPSIPFCYGIRLASGAWCTMMRVNEPVAGAWPTNTEALAVAEHDLSPAQKEAAVTARIEQMKKDAANYPKSAAALGPHLGTDTTGGGAAPHDTTIIGDEDDEEPPHSRSPHTASRSTRRGR
jgi:hypothetical protein